MNRLGLLTPDALNTEQKALYDELDAYTSSKYGSKFTYKLKSTNQFVGPFGIQLHTPEVGHHFLGFATSLAKIPGLSAQAREIAILVVGAHTGAAYEDYAHSRLSQFSEAQEEDIRRGRCPDGLDASETVAFELASELFEKGPLSQNTWNKAVDILSVDGAKALVHYVGFYRYIATILNGFDAQIPE